MDQKGKSLLDFVFQYGIQSGFLDCESKMDSEMQSGIESRFESGLESGLNVPREVGCSHEFD